MNLAVVDVIGIVAGLAVVTFTLIKAASRKPPALVIISTALVALALIAAWLGAPDRGETLVALIGTCVGALAAGVSATFRGPGDE